MKKNYRMFYKDLIKLVTLFTFSIGLFFATQVYAVDDAPEEVIGTAVQTLLDEFTNRRNEFEGDKKALYTMVQDVTGDYFDFDKISKLILSKHWKTATDAQRGAFAHEFRTLLIKTYATALFQYTGKEKMAFKTSDVKERKGVKYATVKSEVSLSDGPPIAVNYSLIEDGGQWKIYNMVIADINLVISYRDTYDSAIRKNGLDGTIESMKNANAAPEISS